MVGEIRGPPGVVRPYLDARPLTKLNISSVSVDSSTGARALVHPVARAGPLRRGRKKMSRALPFGEGPGGK